MYKLVVNNVQIGSYSNMKDMMISVALRSNVYDVVWSGKTLYLNVAN